MSERFIGKYEILTTLGKGSMGVVYKAKDPEIGRLVAIKTLKSVVMGDDAAGEEALQRFRQESRSAGMLHHPNIVTIFEAGKTENGSPYIVMEHIDGLSLEQRVADQGAVAPLEVLHYLAQVASAIDYAHTQNVIHRDIKPSNIIVGNGYKPYLLDFGVAKLADTSLTPAGTVVGTPSYMSPEQIRGMQLDGRTDIFSLAVVAFELFTGVRPYPGKDFTTVVTNIMHKEPRSFAELGVHLPEALEKELHKGLCKDRDQRFTSALAMIHSFAQVYSVLVDGSGLVGGYKPEMEIDRGTLEVEAASKKTTVPVKRPSLADAPRPSGRTRVPSNVHGAQGRLLYGLGFLGLLACGGFVAFAAMQNNAPAPIDSENTASVQVDESPVNSQSNQSTERSDEVPAPREPVLPTEPDSGFTRETLASLSDAALVRLSGQPLSARSLRHIGQEFSSRGAERFIEPCLELLAHDDFSVRVAGLKALRAPELLQNKRVRVAMIRLLEDREYLVRGFAAKILADSFEADVREAMQRQLEVEKHKVVKKVLEQALAK